MTRILTALCLSMLLAVPAIAGTVTAVTVKGLTCAAPVLDAIAQEAGLTTTLISTSREKALAALCSGQADMALLPPDVSVGKEIRNLGPVFTAEYGVIGRAGNYFRSLRELGGKTVAVVRGEEKDERISKRKGIIPRPLSGYEQCLKLLLAGNVDAVAGDICGMAHAVKKMRIPRQALGTPFILSSTPVCLFVSDRLGENIRPIVEALDLLKEKETLKETLVQYSL